MARDIDAADLEQGPQDATQQHNVGARKGQIRGAVSEIRKLEAEAEALRAKVKGLNKSISDIYRKIKSDLGISRKNLVAVKTIIELEDDERNETLDQIREAWEALSEGEQLDWLSATSAPTPNATQPAHGTA